MQWERRKIGDFAMGIANLLFDKAIVRHKTGESRNPRKYLIV